MERAQEEPAAWVLVLELVFTNAAAFGWDLRQRIFIGSYAIQTGVGDAGPYCAPALRVLAPRFLGVVGFGSGVRISLRSRLFSAVTNSSHSRYFEGLCIPK
jgi:hypothetical protein